MALQGPIPVEFATVFTHGVFAAGVFEAVRDFDASTGDRFVQSRDKTTGCRCGRSRSSTPTPKHEPRQSR